MKRTSRRPRRNPSGFPWDGKVVPIDASDMSYMREIERIERERGAELAAQFILFVDRRRFYRRDPPRLGEPIFRYRSNRRMYCGRGSGHLGSGLYFFGTLRAALDGDTPSNVFRIVEGPQNPYITRNREDTHKLHDFGKALLCYSDDLQAYEDAAHRMEESKKRLASFERYSDEWYDLDQEIAENKGEVNDALSRLRRTVRTLQFSGPRWEDPRQAADTTTAISPRCADAIRLYLTRQDYHPMTYYMRSLGYDGVLHRAMQDLESGAIGCIWYPEIEMQANPGSRRSSRPKRAPQGDCYRQAAQEARRLEEEGARLVHGHVEGASPIKHHAWVEVGNMIIDPSATYGDEPGAMPPMTRSQLAKEGLRYVSEASYAPTEALVMMVRQGHWGPWHR